MQEKIQKQDFIDSFLRSDFSRPTAKIPEWLATYQDEILKLFDMGYAKKSVYNFMLDRGILGEKITYSAFLSQIKKILPKDTNKKRTRKSSNACEQ